MTARCYRKEIPRTPIYMPNGDRLIFESLDGVTGYFRTEKPDEAAALDKLEREHRGGVFSITQDEYDRDFAKKKLGSTPSAPSSQWREELASVATPDTLAPRPAQPVVVAAAAVESKPAAPAPAPEVAVKRAVRPPNVGRRI